MDNHKILTDSTIPMGDPIGYFITWATYGTWLPGDQRGWVEYQRGWQLPEPQLELECASRMTEDACRLTPTQREIVENQIRETCRHRGWELHSVNCRSNHCHVAVTAPDVAPKKVRDDLKAWCSRRLNERAAKRRDNWWAERGSIRWIWNQDSLDTVITYINDAQEQKHCET